MGKPGIGQGSGGCKTSFTKYNWANDTTLEAAMKMRNENKTDFLGTYFDRDAVIKLARLAGILGWVFLGFYVYMTLIAVVQYMTFIFSGAIALETMPFIDRLSIPNSFIQQLVPGVVYFILMKAVEQILLIFLDVEDNSRRAARTQSGN
jgi:hypothetical protein